jgi:FMN phosphatase YigB (HAD superfamily)
MNERSWNDGSKPVATSCSTTLIWNQAHLAHALRQTRTCGAGLRSRRRRRTAVRDRYTTARDRAGRFGGVAGRWVFWDFDGTLAARDRTWSGTLLDALAAVDPDHGLTVETLRPQLASRLPWHDAATPHPHLNDADEWWAAMRRLFLGAYLRAGVAEGPARRAARGFRDHYLDTTHWSVFPDSAAALDLLSAAGYQHMIVSNHVPELRRLVSALGLADHFDEVLTFASVGFEKPHPGIFRCALERAGSPRTAYMVGDNPIADVQGARAVGLLAILVRGPNGVGLDDAATEILGGRSAASDCHTGHVPSCPTRGRIRG